MARLESAIVFASLGDWPRVVPAAREALTSDPEDPTAHALLALGLAHLEQGPDAVVAGRAAVALGPELALAHYAHGTALLESAEIAAAEVAAREALRLEPGADEHALLARVHIHQRRWQEALDVAERGLNVDPEHSGCANLRALSLANLGRADEAVAGVHEMLAHDPDDAYAHANRGWLMLRQSRPQEALDSLRAALRLDPTMEWARAGVVEAIKAQNGAYRLILRYAFWVGSLDNRAQWLLVLGLYVGSRIVRAALEVAPGSWPVLGPLLWVYTLFAFGSWIAHPLSNFVLRLHPVGRLALSRSETIHANVVGGWLTMAVLSALWCAVTRSDLSLVVTIVSTLMLVPIGAAIKAAGTRAWRPVSLAAAGLGVVGAVAVVLMLAGSALSGLWFAVFAIGVFAFTWVANILLAKYR